jgi:F-type H+-transporting ATPase subunit delta
LKSASRQYATALAEIALAQGTTEPIRHQLMEFGKGYAQSAELRNFLSNPAVPPKAKHGVIEAIVQRLGAGKIIRNFLFVVVDNQRAQQLPQMIETFQEVIRQRQGVAEADVESAMELNAAQKTQLLETLERLTGKKIQAKYTLDPALLGGAVVRIGDTIFDGSLKNRLNQMRTRLASE